jgi:hypothetical protein
VIIIIVSKPKSRFYPELSLDHRSGVSTQVDPSQCKDTNGYYHSFKIQFRGQPGAETKSWANRIS